MSAAYWTREERESLKKENTDAIARGETRGEFCFSADETYRILATVDALERLLSFEHENRHPLDDEDCALEDCPTRALLAALEGKP